MKATPEYIISKLCGSGFETYVVGGAVRDFLEGRLPSDEDIVTKATPGQIKEIFKDHKIATGGTFFKVTFVDGIEVATFRKDVYRGLNDKDVVVTNARTILEDLGRRDLTINAVAWCQFTGDFVDPYNGIDDLRRRKIKFVGDAEQRIHEDPNRIIRACRFLARIDGEFDPETLDALTKAAPMIEKYVTKERIRIEILKAMKARYASVFFNALHRIGGLKYIVPSLDCCYELEDLHGLHHRESIITHSYVAGDNISTKYPLIKLAAYLHDVGKIPACRWNYEKGDLRFTGHDKIGVDLIKRDLRRLKFSKDEVRYIATLVKLHMNNFATPKAIRRTVSKLNGIDWKDLYRLKLADSKANIWKGPYPLSKARDDLRNIYEALNVGSQNPFGELAINGKDLIVELGIEPGRLIGEIKKHLLEIIIDSPELNNRESLLQIASDYTK